MHDSSPSPRPGAARGPSAIGAVAFLVVALAACSPGASPSVLPTEPLSASTGARPSSPAVVAIVQPQNHAQLTGSSVHVVLSLEHATIVQQTTTQIRPGEGHVHLYVDNVLFSMNYQLQQELPVHPGTYVIRAEFVASDHVPFNPRVWSAPVVFTVK